MEESVDSVDYGLELGDEWAENYYLDFSKTPEVRLSLEEWHALCTAVSLRFGFTTRQYQMLPRSLQAKFTKT